MLLNISILLLAAASTALASSGLGTQDPVIEDKYKAEISRFSEGRRLLDRSKHAEIWAVQDNGPTRNTGEDLAQKTPRKYPDVVLKCSRDKFTAKMAPIWDLRQEFRMHHAASKISPDVLPAYNFIELSPGKYCFTMALARNGDVLGVIRRAHMPMPKPLIKSVIFRVARALAALHIKNIAHRDVKSENVIMKSNGSFKLFDFGDAIYIDKRSDPERQNEYFGTVTLIAPEYLTADGNYLKIFPRDQRPADIFALGKMLQELLTIESRSRWGTRKTIPEPARDLVEKMTAENPNERYTAEQVMKHTWLKTAADVVTNDEQHAMAELLNVAEMDGGAYAVAKVEKWLRKARYDPPRVL